MKILSLFVGILISNVLFGQTSKQSAKSFHNAKSIFDVEIEFSKDAEAMGFRMANLKYAADDALVFRPKIINAKEWSHRLKGLDSSSVVNWYPSFIEISKAGDLGYAVGPFENRSTAPGNSSVAHGQFATVWKQQDDGSLKFIMDFGSGPLPPSFHFEKEPIFDASSAKKFENYKLADSGEEFKKVMDIENKFSSACEKDGDVKAYQKYSTKEIRFFYQREFYLNGLDKVIDALKGQNGHHIWKPSNCTISESGDLAHVYGTHQYLDQDSLKTGYYMRVWKKQPDGNWLIVLQVRNLTAL